MLQWTKTAQEMAGPQITNLNPKTTELLCSMQSGQGDAVMLQQQMASP